jgi:GTP cyclohydrolase I
VHDAATPIAQDPRRPVDADHARHATAALLSALGHDDRAGTFRTPDRVAAFWAEFLAPEPFALTAFDAEGADEMVTQVGIPFYSVCEHHLLPFFGEACVAYVPNGKIVGLSKLARLVQWHARRPQNQERITTLVADALVEGLGAQGVGVQLRARHLCMEMRGVRAAGAETVTTAVRGVFRTDAAARAEFLAAVRGSSR